MNSIIIQLQEQALDNSSTCSDLLRKSFVVAKKLSLHDFEIWTQSELNGYPEGVTLPGYRIIRGELEAWNPYNGWIPLIFENPEEAEVLSKRGVGQSVAELEDIIQVDNKKGSLHITFPKQIELQLLRAGNSGLQPLLRISRAQIAGIINAVRNAILNWALSLEEKGILGEGLRFSKDEIKTAERSNYNITNYIGSMNNSSIQQLSNGSNQESYVK